MTNLSIVIYFRVKLHHKFSLNVDTYNYHTQITSEERARKIAGNPGLIMDSSSTNVDQASADGNICAYGPSGVYPSLYKWTRVNQFLAVLILAALVYAIIKD